MKYTFFIILSFLVTGTFAQDEIEYFAEDSFKLRDFPTEPTYLRVGKEFNLNDYWKGIIKDGGIHFYDEDYAEFYGDSLPFSIDSLRNLVDCRFGGGDYHILKAHEGWYFGTNRGEWGGLLFKFSKDLKECERICFANVNQLLKYNERVFLVEGLSHLGLSSGCILEINTDLSIDTLLKLDETPYQLIFTDQENGFLLTASGVYSINSKMDTIRLYKNENWISLYPSQMLYHDDKLYAPMRGGIAVYFIRTKELKLLVKE